MLRVFVLRDETHCRSLYAFLRANWLAMAQAGKPLGVLVAEHKAKRSNPQNRLYWLVLNEIAANGWVDGKRFSAEAWHYHFRKEFIGMEDGPNGASVPISTTTLNVSEFSEYLEKVMAYAAQEIGCSVAL